MEDSGKITRRTGLLAGLAGLLTLLALVPAAWGAGTYHAEVCSDLTTGAAAPADRWVMSYYAPEGYADAGPCSPGGTMYADFQAAVAHAYGDYEQMQFSAPANTSISAFSLWRISHVGPNQPYGTPQAGIQYDATWADLLSSGGSVVDAGNASSPSGSTVSMSGLNAQSVTMRVNCGGGSGGSCAAGGTGTWIHIQGGDITLSASASPSVSGVSGPLTTTSTLSGTKSISYNATDSGGGVYSGTLIVDGATGPSAIANTNGGNCQATRVNSDGSRVFNYAVPCPLSTSGTVSLDTSQLTDGSHTLQLVVDDAAGNKTSAYNGTITTRNAPVNTAAPVITGSGSGKPQEGQTLTVTGNGSWSPTASSYTYQWYRCDAAGQNCKAISGSTNPTYVLATADDYGLVYAAVTANNTAGASPPANSNAIGPIADTKGNTSPPTGPTGISCTTACAGTGTAIGGNPAPVPDPGVAPTAPCTPVVNTSVKPQPDGTYLLSGSVTCNGVAIAGAQLTVTDSNGLSRTLTTTSDGTFSTVLKQVGAGLTVTYKGVATPVPAVKKGASISLNVSPGRTRNHHKVWFRGKVTGVAIAARHRPILLVEYQYKGKWHPFDKVKLRKDGSYVYSYEFKRTRQPTVFHFRVALSSQLASAPRTVRVMP